ncbi:MAG: hypothetical protein DRH90_21435 [Deltaproteobacteria bacterium]|nr:MAG: hypothetical protein DRH90_21435 [Deltaproteobacteria bacterium]
MLLKLPSAGVKGYNSDIDPWDLPPEFLTEGINFRVDANAVSSQGGYSKTADAPTDYYPGFMILARTRSTTFVVMAGRDAVYAYVGQSYTDIGGGTVSLSTDDEYFWGGTLSGSVLLLNNRVLYPLYWTGSGAVKELPWDIAAGLTWKDKGFTCDSLRSHKNFLLALSLHESIDKPDSFRWSHPADENGIPFTWDETNPAGIAGIQSLGGDGGRIIDGLSLRDSFIIYSQNAIDVLDLSGDEFVWRRRSLSATVGLLSKDCVVEVKGKHYLMTDGDIVVNDGNSIVSIAHNAIQNRIKISINTEFVDRSFAVSIDAHKEIWFCVPEGDSENVNIAYIYQWKEQTWAIRDLPSGTAFIIAAPESTDAEGWEDANVTWASRIDRWSDGVSRVSFDELPYGVNAVNSDLQLLQTPAPIEDLGTILERTDLGLIDQVAVTTITRLYPHIRGSEPVRIQVGSQDFPGSAVRWKPYNIFDPTKDRKVDVRTTGALHAYRVMSEGKGEFRFSGVDVEYEQDGVR